MRLLVIDGNSIANRAFYGIKLLTTKDGRYTNAIFGFLNIMNSLLRECEPDEVAIAFDLKHPTFRHEMYDGYKGTRHAMPDELAQQMPILKELLTDLGYRQVSAKGWEADDILGTLAAACEARRDDCFLATGDRDSLQLVSETTTVLLATSAMGRSKTETMDLDAIHEKYGIEPKQLIEVKSLMGDTSDNIPGVKGIGEKTAMTLVKNFGTLDSVYDHLDSPIIKPRQRENLLTCREDAYLSHTLAHGAWQMIFGVNTLPEYRKQGLAGQLLRRAIADAKAQGRRGLVLTCKDRLVHYYAGFGFVSEGVSGSTHGGVVWYQMRLTF